MSARVVVVAAAGVADPIATGLRAAGLDVRGCAEDVHQLPEHADVVVLDLAVAGPDPDGAEGVHPVETLLDAAPSSTVLAVGESVEHVPVLAALRAGASGFVRRDCGWTELAEAVTRVAAGEVVFGPGVADLVLDSYGTAAADPVSLTERELDIVRLVVDGLTARQIAVRLVLSPRTVENHVHRIVRKLGLAGRAALVRYAIENGLA
ncbi:DNA-binding response regulator [Pseudonocardia sulfidoxydans NBRC 16205]|uniref:DNA-binding response regulator n=2 Tax=Pseudonocardia sulfidoxydans TaxID=54011 RepID=A0A511DJY9_9PSEU|nr:response regulator transcription factor [Pseudonocardia sulfidoxydans]GEL25126.1 DNA-binding response regulator [Pseudonocardia sulfidoxydans NBRC 16205]